jgi:tetratricopeptide (TPR) repeat protein
VPMPEKNELKQLLSRELDALNLRQVEKRLAVFKKWLDRDPKNLSLLILLSRSYANVGVFDQAMVYAERANTRYPKNADVQQALGNIAYMQNDYAKAIEVFTRALKLEETGALHLNLALCYLKSNKLSDARKAFAKAKKLDPELTSNYIELAQLLE